MTALHARLVRLWINATPTWGMTISRIPSFAQRWAGNMLYVPERDRWAEWNGKVVAIGSNGKRTRSHAYVKTLREIPGAEDPAKEKTLEATTRRSWLSMR